MVIDYFSHGLTDALDLGEIGYPGVGNFAGRAEMMEKRPFAVRADTRNIVEQGAAYPPRALGTVGADGETVGLVAQPLQEIENRVTWWQGKGRAAGHEETFSAGVPVRPLGDTDHGKIIDAHVAEDP